MAPSSRDRVTLDLRGIGPAVRAAAHARQITVAAFCREVLVAAAGIPLASSPIADRRSPIAGDGPHRSQSTNLTLRLSQLDAELPIVSAVKIGLSYGAFVSRLVRGAPLPARAADRAADRAALIASVDRLTELSADLNALVRLLRTGKSEGTDRYRASALSPLTEVQRHLDLASRVIARHGGDS